eukprot:m.68220 g.68220  ORF g.68220 m.68220 type:complete len:314 (-) comp15979_c0_seq15:134-1075(-)
MLPVHISGLRTLFFPRLMQKHRRSEQHENCGSDSDQADEVLDDVTAGLLTGDSEHDDRAGLQDVVPMIEAGHDRAGGWGRRPGGRMGRGSVGGHQQRSGLAVATTGDDVVIGSTVLVTVLLWVFFASVEDVVGNIGIVGLLPILVFGALGYLERADFNALSWDTLMLMGGGLSLGTAVESSGLLLTVGNAMAAFTSTASVFVVLLCFTSLVAAVATVISSTVAAALLLPIVATVGMGIGHAKMLVILCAMMTSGAMGLPVSSFPNANAKAQGTPAGVSLLKGVDFLKTGVPMTVVVLAVILSLGFGLCHVYGD